MNQSPQILKKSKALFSFLLFVLLAFSLRLTTPQSKQTLSTASALAVLPTTSVNRVPAKAEAPSKNENIEFVEAELFEYKTYDSLIQLPEVELGSLANCLKSPDSLKGSDLTKRLGVPEWTRTCELEILTQKALEHPNPALRLIALRLITNEAIKKRQSIYDAKFSRPTDTQTDLWKWTKNLMFGPQTLQVPQTFFDLSSESTIAFRKVVQDQTLHEYELSMQLMQKIPTWLNIEFQLERLDFLGESLRFSELLSSLNTMFSMNSLPNETLREIYFRVDRWIEKWGASELESWLLEKYLKLTSKAPQGSNPNELHYWLRSFELLSLESLEDKKTEILASLRKLWVLYSAEKDQKRLQSTIARIGLTKEFKAPGVKDFSFDELLTRARSQVKKLDTAGALRLMKEVLRRDNLSSEELWEALQLHLRALRLEDNRVDIPPTIKKYLAKAKIIDLEKKGSELTTHVNRALQLTRFYWTYQDRATAESYLNDLIALLKNKQVQFSQKSVALNEGLYLRARMAEQQEDKAAALPYFEEALSQPNLLADYKYELLWRYFYLKFELLGKTVSNISLGDLRKILDDIEKNPLIQTEKSRLIFWRAKLAKREADETPQLKVKEKLDQEAEKFLKEAYKIDPWSFYGNVAAIELRSLSLELEPPWLLNVPGESKLERPEWSLFLADQGRPKEKDFEALARSFVLALMGEKHLLKLSYDDLDRSVLAYIRKKGSEARSLLLSALWLHYAGSDPLGALRLTESSRILLKDKLTTTEFYFLYPTAYSELIETQANQKNIDAIMATSLMRQESAFDAKAKSFANALGLMQMIPVVAQREAQDAKLKSFLVEDLYQPEIAVKLGTQHMSRVYQQCRKSWICALASYNAGFEPVEKWINYYHSTYPLIFIERISYLETKNYVKSILRNYLMYKRLYGKETLSKNELQELFQINPSS